MIGQPLERLAPRERIAVTGKWAAFEIYTPETLPLRRIEALGDSTEACIEQLIARGLDPARFEFVLVAPLFHSA